MSDELYESELRLRRSHNLYLHLRTRLIIEESFGAFEELWGVSTYYPEEPTSLVFPRAPEDGADPWSSSLLWTHGVVLRWRTPETPRQLAARLREPLTLFEGWQIHGRGPDFVESDAPGLMGAYYQNLGVGKRSSLLAAMADPDHRFVQQDIERFMRSLPRGSRIVMKFDDGFVAMAPEAWAPEMFRGRLRNCGSAILHWGGVGDQEEPFYRGDYAPGMFSGPTLYDLATPRERNEVSGLA